MKMRAIPLFFLAVSVSTSHQTGRDDVTHLLDAHNFYRAQVGVPPLVWSTRLALRSQQWAEQLLEQGRFAPRRDGQFGENLYAISGASASPLDVVAAWMSERKNYHESANTCSGRCGHYTQVVWRATHQLGCGVARDRTQEVWVCNYDPPGNVIGERPY